MHRARALVNVLFANARYRDIGHCTSNSVIPVRLLAVAANEPSPTAASAAGQTQKLESDQANQPFRERSDRPPPRFGTLEFLLKRRMPVNSIRLLTNGVRLACDERRGEAMIPYLGAWLAQVTRPDNLERLLPWVICDILRDLGRLTRIVSFRQVRDALPPKHLQTLANRLVVQGFDKLTPMQLARAAEGFGRFRPFMSFAARDEAAIDSDEKEGKNANLDAWPTTDWVDELVDWLHNLKPDIEPWPRTSAWCLATVLLGLARSNYKPRQPTFQAVATAMKMKLEDQLKSGYLSRGALANSSMAWNIWRVNPEEYAPGYWDVYFKTASQIMEEYVDSVPDPPSVEEGLSENDSKADEGDNIGGPQRRRPFSISLLTKRREFRKILDVVVTTTKNFNLSKQFEETVKSIWERRLDEHARFVGSSEATRILNACENLNITIKPETREMLMAAKSKGFGRRQDVASADRDIDEFDDSHGPGRGRNFGGNRENVGGRGRNEMLDDFDDSPNQGRSRNFGGDRGASFSRGRNEMLDDFDDLPNPGRGSRGGAGSRGRNEMHDDYQDFEPDDRDRKLDRRGARDRRGGEFQFDDKPF